MVERIGGNPAVESAVEEFYARVLAERQLKQFFRDVDMDELKRQQRAFLTQALGGPARYRGPDIKSAHAHLPTRENAKFGRSG